MTTFTSFARRPSLVRASMATLSVATLIATFANDAHAYSGFTQTQYGLYSKLSVSTFSSNNFYTLDGELRDRGQSFSQQALNLYTEFGLLDDLTFVASLPVLRLNAFANTNTVSGIGDVQLGLKYGVQLFGFHVAAMVTPEIPLGRAEAFALIEEDVDNRINLPTGDGEFNVWTRLAISRPIPVIDAYASTDVGINLRTEGFSHQVNFGAEFGYNLLKIVWLQLKLRGLFSVGEPDRTVPFIYGEGTEYLSFGVGASVQVFDPIGLTFDYTNVFAAQKNVYGGSNFGFGVSVAL